MSFSDLNYFDYFYIILLIIFAVFFGIKGATRSISYSLKIILSISLPFIFYKRVLNFSLEKLKIYTPDFYKMLYFYLLNFSLCISFFLFISLDFLIIDSFCTPAVINPITK